MFRAVSLLIITLTSSLLFSYMSNKNKYADDELTFAEENGLGAYVSIRIYGMDNYYAPNQVYLAPGWQYKTLPKEGNYVTTWLNPSSNDPSYYQDSEGSYFFWDPVRHNWAKTK